MEQLMTAEESYVERRRLFKDIWTTAMNIDEQDTEFLNRPKVIKTLRLDSVDRSGEKKKKQRIKNLRTVCNKILDFCDKQDAEDMVYAQLTTEGHIPHQQKMETLIKKQKTKIKKKDRKSRRLLSLNKECSPTRAITSEGKREIITYPGKATARHASPIKLETTAIIKKPVISNKPLATDLVETVNTTVEAQRRKIVKKKISKRKKPSVDLTPPPGIIDDWF